VATRARICGFAHTAEPANAPSCWDCRCSIRSGTKHATGITHIAVEVSVIAHGQALGSPRGAATASVAGLPHALGLSEGGSSCLLSYQTERLAALDGMRNPGAVSGNTPSCSTDTQSVHGRGGEHTAGAGSSYLGACCIPFNYTYATADPAAEAGAGCVEAAQVPQQLRAAAAQVIQRQLWAHGPSLGSAHHGKPCTAHPVPGSCLRVVQQVADWGSLPHSGCSSGPPSRLAACYTLSGCHAEMHSTAVCEPMYG
jgi:hypothetical protein